MKSDFKNEIYAEAKKLFPEGQIETLIKRARGVHVSDATVRVVHTLSGAAVTCDDYPTQVENYTAAVIRLRILCDQKKC